VDPEALQALDAFLERDSRSPASETEARWAPASPCPSVCTCVLSPDSCPALSPAQREISLDTPGKGRYIEEIAGQTDFCRESVNTLRRPVCVCVGGVLCNSLGTSRTQTKLPCDGVLPKDPFPVPQDWTEEGSQDIPGLTSLLHTSGSTQLHAAVGEPHNNLRTPSSPQQHLERTTDP
jgi:hypothetical protein